MKCRANSSRFAEFERARRRRGLYEVLAMRERTICSVSDRSLYLERKCSSLNEGNFLVSRRLSSLTEASARPLDGGETTLNPLERVDADRFALCRRKIVEENCSTCPSVDDRSASVSTWKRLHR